MKRKFYVVYGDGTEWKIIKDKEGFINSTDYCDQNIEEFESLTDAKEDIKKILTEYKKNIEADLNYLRSLKVSDIENEYKSYWDE